MAEPLFRVGVALATLFEDDGEVDVKATADFAANLAGLGIRRWRWPGRPARRPPSPPRRIALLTETRRAVPPRCR